MKKTLLLLSLVLGGFGAAVAQQYQDQAAIGSTVRVGAFSEEKAINYLTASNKIENGAAAYYVAGQSVTLQPGFVAEAGAIFSATIDKVESLNAENNTFTLTAFPNPFEESTNVRFVLPEAAKIRQTLTNAQGMVIRQDDSNEIQNAGSHETSVEGRNLPAGVYLYQVQTDKANQVIRLLKK
jgi:Secretion system C-terminal sorting domain